MKKRLNVLLQVFLWPRPRAATADEIGTFYIELGVQKSTRGEHEFDMNDHSRLAIEGEILGKRLESIRDV